MAGIQSDWKTIYRQRPTIAPTFEMIRYLPSKNYISTFYSLVEVYTGFHCQHVIYHCRFFFKNCQLVEAYRSDLPSVRWVFLSALYDPLRYTNSCHKCQQCQERILLQIPGFLSGISEQLIKKTSHAID